ncbi:hypothetical protein J6590_051963 [Homalodisca vitripennis]|nr:hypothetical protein J6590_051963 [Homalodisca vitripennis]
MARPVCLSSYCFHCCVCSCGPWHSDGTGSRCCRTVIQHGSACLSVFLLLPLLCLWLLGLFIAIYLFNTVIVICNKAVAGLGILTARALAAAAPLYSMARPVCLSSYCFHCCVCGFCVPSLHYLFNTVIVICNKAVAGLGILTARALAAAAPLYGMARPVCLSSYCFHCCVFAGLGILTARALLLPHRYTAWLGLSVCLPTASTAVCGFCVPSLLHYSNCNNGSCGLGILTARARCCRTVIQHSSACLSVFLLLPLLCLWLLRPFIAIYLFNTVIVICNKAVAGLGILTARALAAAAPLYSMARPVCLSSYCFHCCVCGFWVPSLLFTYLTHCGPWHSDGTGSRCCRTVIRHGSACLSVFLLLPLLCLWLLGPFIAIYLFNTVIVIGNKAVAGLGILTARALAAAAPLYGMARPVCLSSYCFHCCVCGFWVTSLLFTYLTQ